MGQWMIEVDEVSKAFGEVHALRDVSFVVGAGEVLGLLGPNGAGKTTLVRIIATLLAPDRGAVRVGGVDVARDPSQARRLLGLAGQSAAVDELLTGRENLELIGSLYGLDRATCTQRAGETLAWLDLVDAGDRRVGTFSGGMRRRLDLGATLIGRPSVILLDEPTAGLDPRSRNELWTLVRRIAADGTTVLLTSQYLEEVERLAERIVVFNDGGLIADAPPVELKRAISAELVEARVVYETDVARVATLLRDVGDTEPVVEADARRVSVVTSKGMPSLIAAAQGLDLEGIAVSALGSRQPSLDEVFLTLTAGTAATDQPIRVARGEPPVARVTENRSRARPLRDMAVVTGLYLRRFSRIPQMFIFGAAQPVAFVLGLEAAFGGLVEGATGTSYIQYLLPGVIVMHVLFAGSVTSAGIAEDMQAGIIDRFRSLPMSRAAVLVGRTAADLFRNAIGLAMALLTGLALGFRFHGTAFEAVAAIALVLAFSYATSWLFACVGIAVRSPQAAQLAGFLPALPLVYLSGAWIPVESMDGALQAFARNQPINVVIDSVRSFTEGAPADVLGQAVAWIVAILAFSIPTALRLYRRV